MNLLKTYFRTYAMVIALILIWIVFNEATDGAFLQARNLSNLLRQMAVTGIVAGGMVLIIVTGQIDLSIGSTVAFLGGLLAMLNTQKGMDPTLAFLITVACGLLIGAVQGYLHSYQHIPSFIVTLGGMMTFRGAAMWITSNSTIPLEDNWIGTVGTAYVGSHLGWIITTLVVLMAVIMMGISFQSRPKEHRKIWSLLYSAALLAIIAFGSMWIFSQHNGIPVPVLLMLVILTLIHLLATRTIWGRYIYATGGNREAAFLSGVNVHGVTLFVFVLMGMLTSIAAVVLTARVGSASPDAGQLLELDAIAACVIGGTSLIGGKGSVFGALLGGLVIESLNNGMSLANMEPYWQYIIKGLVLVGAVGLDVASRERAS